MMCNFGAPGEPDGTLSLEQRQVAALLSAARWIVAAFASIAAILVAGLQVGQVGTIGAHEPLRLVVGLGSGAVALLAVVGVLARASAVITSPRISLVDLVQREVRAATKAAQRSGGDPAGAPDPSDLDELLGAISIHRKSLLYSDAKGPQQLYELLKKARAEGGDLQLLEKDEERLADFSTLKEVERRYSKLLHWVMAVLGVVAICIVALSWAVSKQPSPRVASPLTVRIILQGSAKALAHAGVDTDCTARELSGVAVDAALSEPEVVTEPTAHCPAMRLVVTKEVGIAIPVLGQSTTSSP